MPGLNTWQQLTQPSLAYLLMGCHTQRFQPTLVHLKVSRCGAAHSNKDGGHMKAAQTHPILFILLSKFRINMCLCPLDEKNRNSA